MSLVAAGFYVLAYVLAVVDGARQKHLLYAGDPIGFRRFMKDHPWLVAGALCGVVGTVLAALDT